MMLIELRRGFVLLIGLLGVDMRVLVLVAKEIHEGPAQALALGTIG